MSGGGGGGDILVFFERNIMHVVIYMQVTQSVHKLSLR